MLSLGIPRAGHSQLHPPDLCYVPASQRALQISALQRGPVVPHCSGASETQDDDGEQSWRGVATGDSGGESSVYEGDEQGEAELASLSGDEEPSGSEENEDDSGDDDDFFGDEELEAGQGDGNDPLDTLLHVIKNYRS